MEPFSHPSIPSTLAWCNEPHAYAIDPSGALSITAGERTDWFIDPAGAMVRDSAPAALFVPPDGTFTLSARVRVHMDSTFDAGVLFAYARPDLWAKLCLEFSPQRRPMIVSVVTKGRSDDCNSVELEEPDIFLRMARSGGTFAFHFSPDGRYWHLVRHFTLGDVEELQIGFSAQSPTGPGCTAVFSDVSYRAGAVEDIRSGQ
jgi:regulation of enolase protein 1 (concanavalin A-like superfamily)